MRAEVLLLPYLGKFGLISKVSSEYLRFAPRDCSWLLGPCAARHVERRSVAADSQSVNKKQSMRTYLA
jgi:hypothetical protein